MKSISNCLIAMSPKMCSLSWHGLLSTACIANSGSCREDTLCSSLILDLGILSVFAEIWLSQDGGGLMACEIASRHQVRRSSLQFLGWRSTLACQLLLDLLLNGGTALLVQVPPGSRMCILGTQLSLVMQVCGEITPSSSHNTVLLIKGVKLLYLHHVNE